MLALLLLHADEIVPIERLVDELWGERPPGSAQHTLEAYVSRLRATLEPHGSTIVRRGRGYVLELHDATLDAREFSALVDAAAAAGDPARAGQLAADALAYWRGKPLLDAGFASPPVEVATLEELRRRALELRIDAELAAGRHAEVVGELLALVEEYPYAERLVAHLMIALYRTGRQAEAVAVYEEMRRRMADELGLQPSPELQALSAQIVRHEEHLAAPSVTAAARPRRRRPVLVAAAAAAAVGAVALAAWAFDGGPSPSKAENAHAVRVALIVPRLPLPGQDDVYIAPFLDGLGLAAREYGVKTQILVGDEIHINSPLQQRLAARIRRAKFDLVIVASQPEGGQPLLRTIVATPNTRYVFLDTYPGPWDRKVLRRPNVTVVQFADEQAGYLAGYLTGLVERSKTAAPIASVVGVRFPDRLIPQVTHLVTGFERGVRAAAPHARVLESWSSSFTGREQCARLATRQIDAGSKVVFAAAGICGLGAIAVAGIRGVRAIGADADRSDLGSHVLASTLKRFDRAVFLGVRWYTEGTLPRGGTIHLGLDQDAVGIVGISQDVSSDIRAELARQAAALRKRHDGLAP